MRVAAAAAAVAVVASACGSGDGDDGNVSSAATETSSSAEADRDATLRVAINYVPTTLDPHRVSSTLAGQVYLGLLYDRLTQIGPGLQAEPMVATGWEFAEDGGSVTFALRDDVTFWDGTPVDAAAVKASFDRALTLPESTVKGTLAMIESVEAVDAGTLRITTNRPAADLPYILAGPEGAIINPAQLTNPALDREPAGSGAYTLAAFSSGDSATFARAEHYWDPQAQLAAEVVVRGIPNDSARMSALSSGEVDLAMTTLGQYDQATRLGDDFETHVYPAASTYMMYLHSGAVPTDDPLVRQALNWAIDRESISTALLNGKCDPAVQPLGPAYEAHLEDPPVEYGYDPERARELLEEAGVAEGTRMRVLVPAGLTLYEDIATAIQGQLAEVGIDMEIVSQESTQIFTSWAETIDYAGFVNVRATRPTEATTLEAGYLNPARYPGPVPEKFTEAVRAAYDPTLGDHEVGALLEEASTIAVEEAFDVFICHSPAVWTSTDHVIGADSMGWSHFTAFGDLRHVGIAKD